MAAQEGAAEPRGPGVRFHARKPPGVPLATIIAAADAEARRN